MIYERAFSFVMLSISVVFLSASLDLPLYANNGLLGSGFFPRNISIILIILLIIHIVKGFFSKSKKEPREQRLEKGVIKNQFTLIILLLISLAIINITGMLISLGLFIFIMLFFVEKMRWQRAIVFSLLFILAIYLIFEIGFGLIIPKGLLGI